MLGVLSWVAVLLVFSSIAVLRGVLLLPSPAAVSEVWRWATGDRRRIGSCTWPSKETSWWAAPAQPSVLVGHPRRARRRWIGFQGFSNGNPQNCWDNVGKLRFEKKKHHCRMIQKGYTWQYFLGKLIYTARLTNVFESVGTYRGFPQSHPISHPVHSIPLYVITFPCSILHFL